MNNINDLQDNTPIKLTQYSHGAGCGCKISPKVLNSILAQCKTEFPDSFLLVGNSTLDDAAVYDIGNNQVIISTNRGEPLVLKKKLTLSGIAFENAARRLVGKQDYFLNLDSPYKGMLDKLKDFLSFEN